MNITQKKHRSLVMRQARVFSRQVWNDAGIKTRGGDEGECGRGGRAGKQRVAGSSCVPSINHGRNISLDHSSTLLADQRHYEADFEVDDKSMTSTFEILNNFSFKMIASCSGRLNWEVR